jgi:hypothetical protein
MLRRSNEAPGGNQVWQWRESTIYAEMLLDMGDANFELEPLVDFAVFEFAQLGVDAIELCDSTPIIPTLNDGFRLSARCLVVGSALCASLISPGSSVVCMVGITSSGRCVRSCSAMSRRALYSSRSANGKARLGQPQKASYTPLRYLFA